MQTYMQIRSLVSTSSPVSHHPRGRLDERPGQRGWSCLSFDVELTSELHQNSGTVKTNFIGFAFLLCLQVLFLLTEHCLDVLSTSAVTRGNNQVTQPLTCNISRQ